MRSALIKTNKVFCSKCESDEVKICDYDLYALENTKFYGFTIKCDKCGEKSAYCLDLEMVNRVPFQKGMTKQG